jgi:4-amino-4-deoxy-L-arabinose transferase-like glycosyltransferase
MVARDSRDNRLIARDGDASWLPAHGTVGLGLVLLVAYVCFFNGLTAFGLVGPDEPRYASIAREMADGGDWVTPRLHGEPWLEKPILYYWVAAIGYRVFGDGELAARLPSVLGAVTTLLALGWVARRFYGQTTTTLFALVFPSSIAVLAFARAATPDMLFSSTLALALAAAAPLVLSTPVRAAWAYQAAFGAALGLGVLAKGPAAVVLAGGGAVLGALCTKRGARVSRLAGPWALASFAVVALPWYVLCSLRNPEFIQVFLISHNVERFLTPVFQHQQPFWYFGPVLLLGLAPWTAAIVATAREAAIRLARRPWSGSPSIFLASWVLIPVAFFSLSQSKLPGYVLPAVPAAALLLAHGLAVTLRGSPERARAIGLGTAVALGAMTLAFLVAPGVKSAGVEAGAVRPLAMMLGIAAVVAGVVGNRGQLRAAVAVSALGVTLTLWQLNAVLLPRLDPLISSRTAAHDAANVADGAPIHAFDLHRTWQYGLEYYLHQQVPEWNSREPGGSIVITTDRGMRTMQVRGASLRVLRRVSDNAVVVQTDLTSDRLAQRR